MDRERVALNLAAGAVLAFLVALVVPLLLLAYMLLGVASLVALARPGARFPAFAAATVALALTTAGFALAGVSVGPVGIDPGQGAAALSLTFLVLGVPAGLAAFTVLRGRGAARRLALASLAGLPCVVVFSLTQGAPAALIYPTVVATAALAFAAFARTLRESSAPARPRPVAPQA